MATGNILRSPVSRVSFPDVVFPETEGTGRKGLPWRGALPHLALALNRGPEGAA